MTGKFTQEEIDAYFEAITRDEARNLDREQKRDQEAYDLALDWKENEKNRSTR